MKLFSSLQKALSGLLLFFFPQVEPVKEYDQYQEAILRLNYVAKLSATEITDTRRFNSPAKHIMDHIALLEQAHCALEASQAMRTPFEFSIIRACDWYRTKDKFISIPSYVDTTYARRLLCEVAVKFLTSYKNKEMQAKPGVDSYNLSRLAILAENTIELSYFLVDD